MSREPSGLNQPRAEQIWSLIEALNREFEYGEQGNELEFWANMLESQVYEIREHLAQGETRAAQNEFADTIFVATKALMESHTDHRELIRDRAHDVIDRADRIQDDYAQGDGYKPEHNPQRDAGY